MNNELAIANKIEFTQDQVQLIRSQIAPKANDNELKLFLYQAQRTGLDPMARQIYAIHRWNSGQGKEVMTIQVSIDGFRVIAERSGDYGGQDEPMFTEQDGKLICCKVTVYRFKGSTRYPAAVGLAYWNEYVQTGKDGKPSGLWAKMPHTMLAKVAEALALRKAFPADLSGLYTTEEMNQADKPQMHPDLLNDPEFDDIPDEGEKQLLRDLVFSSTLDESQRLGTLEKIEQCMDYKKYDLIRNKLEMVQAGYNDVPNPNATDAKKAVKRIVGQMPKETVNA
jgi:phage recombination protein Bet